MGLKIRNILKEPSSSWAYDVDNYKYKFDEYGFGTDYTFSITYKNL